MTIRQQLIFTLGISQFIRHPGFVLLRDGVASFPDAAHINKLGLEILQYKYTKYFKRGNFYKGLKNYDEAMIGERYRLGDIDNLSKLLEVYKIFGNNEREERLKILIKEIHH